MRMMRAMMARMVGVEMLALVMRARVAPMADPLGVVAWGGRHETAAAVAMLAVTLMEKGEGGRRGHHAPRQTQNERESDGFLHDLLPLTISGAGTAPACD